MTSHKNYSSDVTLACRDGRQCGGEVPGFLPITGYCQQNVQSQSLHQQGQFCLFQQGAEQKLLHGKEEVSYSGEKGNEKEK